MKKEYPKRIMAVFILLVLTVVAALLYFSGCVAIPENALVVSGSDNRVVNRTISTCGIIENELAESGHDQGIDPASFSILSWNSHKGGDAAWSDDFVAYAEKVDLVLLQEAALDGGLKDRLRQLSSKWLLAIAFETNQKEIGILSAGRQEPLSYCATREPEPLFKIPKMALASTYRLKGLAQRLLVVNVHMVNFTLGSEQVKHQIEAIKDIVRKHQGPVIIAGDFNTWSDERESVVFNEMEALGLQEVRFSPDNRVEFFNRTVDGVYYRGLEVIGSQSYKVITSDHNPLEVQFRLASVLQPS